MIHVILQSEQHARTSLGTNLALCRPSGHVVWRGNTILEYEEAKKEILAVVSGWKMGITRSKRCAKTGY